jgi:hypothetical protein
VKRSCIIVVSAVLALALAAPGVAHAGWSWNEGAAVSADTTSTDDSAPDGWSWGGESSQPSPDGWTWGE